MLDDGHKRTRAHIDPFRIASRLGPIVTIVDSIMQAGRPKPMPLKLVASKHEEHCYTTGEIAPIECRIDEISMHPKRVGAKSNIIILDLERYDLD